MTVHQVSNWNNFFTQVTQDHWDSIFRFLISLTHNEAEAEDLLQQTLMKALKSFAEFYRANYQIETLSDAVLLTQSEAKQSVIQHIQNWMMKIAKNTFLDSVQRSSRKLRHFPIEDWDESERSNHPADTHLDGYSTSEPQKATPEEAEAEFFNLALDDQWAERLAELSPKQRTILYLAAEEYSYKDIAQILDIPIGTVMSNLSRTIAKLKKTAK